MSGSQMFMVMSLVLAAGISSALGAAAPADKLPPVRVAITGRHWVHVRWKDMGVKYNFDKESFQAHQIRLDRGVRGRVTKQDEYRLLQALNRPIAEAPQALVLTMHHHARGGAWNPANLTAELQEAIMDYVKRGGKLYINGPGVLADTTLGKDKDGKVVVISWKATAGKVSSVAGKKVLADLTSDWLFVKDPDQKGDGEKWRLPAHDRTGWRKFSAGRNWQEIEPGYYGTAWYAKTIVVPQTPEEKLGLFFGGVDQDTWIYLDGKLIGEHHKWDEAFILSLRPKPAPGKHELVVKVRKLAYQTGIYKDVKLIAEGKEPVTARFEAMLPTNAWSVPPAVAAPPVDAKAFAKFRCGPYGKGAVLVGELGTPGKPHVQHSMNRVVRWLVFGDAGNPATMAPTCPDKAAPGETVKALVPVANWNVAQALLSAKLLAPGGKESARSQADVPVAKGQQKELSLAITVPANWHGGKGTVRFELRDPAGQLLAWDERPLTAEPAWACKIETDADGCEKAGEIKATALFDNKLAEGARFTAEVTLEDRFGRVFFRHREPLEVAKGASRSMEATFPVGDLPVECYFAVARVLREDEEWQRADAPVQRYGVLNPFDTIQWTFWQSCIWGGQRRARLRELYKDTGVNAILLGRAKDDRNLSLAEREGWRLWSRSLGHLRVGGNRDGDPQDGSFEGIKGATIKRFSELILEGRRDPFIRHPRLTFICHDGENSLFLPEGAAFERAFRDYLREQYGTLDALNAEWRTGYKTWQEVPTERKVIKGDRKPGYAGYYKLKYPPPDQSQAPIFDYERFLGVQARLYERAWTAGIQELSPGILTNNEAGWPPLGGMSTNNLEYCKPWLGAEQIAWFDLMAQPRFARDSHSRGTFWASYAWPAFPKMVWATAIRGARIFDFWLDHKWYWGGGWGYPTTTGSAGSFGGELGTEEHSPASLAMKRLASEFKLMEPVLLDAFNRNSTEVAYYSPFSNWLYHYGTWAPLYYGGYDPDFIGDSTKLRNYKVILADCPYVNEKIAKDLRDFVEAGGTLIVFPGFGRYNMHGNYHEEAPGLGLSDLTGLRVEKEFVEGVDPLWGAKKPGQLKGAYAKAVMNAPALSLEQGVRLPTSKQRHPAWYQFHFGYIYRRQPTEARNKIAEVLPGTTVLAAFDDGTNQPALTARKLGKGAVYRFNFGIGWSLYFVFRDEGYDQWSEFFAGLLAEAGVQPVVRVRGVDGRPLPQVAPALLYSKQGRSRYLVLCSDFVQRFSTSLDTGDWNGAAHRILLPASTARAEGGKLTDGVLTLEGEKASGEFTVQVAAEGEYRLWLERRVTEPAGIRITVDGDPQPVFFSLPHGIGAGAAPAYNKDAAIFGRTWRLNKWGWESGRAYRLTAGKHVIRLEATEGATQIRRLTLLSPPYLKASVKLPGLKLAAVVDCLTTEKITFRNTPSGAELQVLLAPGQGRVFSLLETAPGKVKVKLPRSVRRGTKLTVSVSTKMSRGSKGDHAYHVQVVDESGKPIPNLEGNVSGPAKARITFRTALNDPEGRWKVIVRDVTAGLKAEAGLRAK